MEKELIKKDYYSVGSREDIVVSNSSLSYLQPEQGGSIQKFLSFFDKQVEIEENKSLENGKLVHLYAEKPQEFAVANVPRPDGMIASMADEFYKLKNNLSSIEDLNNVGITIVSDLKTEKGRESENKLTLAAFEKLASLVDKPVEDTIRLFRLSRIRTEVYKSYKEETLINKFISDCILYINELDQLQGKIPLTKSTQEVIEKVIASLRANELANKYFNLSGLFESNLIYKELDVYFEVLGIKCKAKLDNIYVDLENKIIYLNDLKTTSKPLSLFKESFEYYRYYRQIAFYKRALYHLLNLNLLGEGTVLENIQLKDFEVKCQIIAVETTENFECQIFNVDQYLDKGREEVVSLLNRLKYHIDFNVWNQSMENFLGKGIINLIPDDK
jgi:hypothetical protein